MPKRSNQPSFANWAQKFFKYLEKEKNANSALLNLIHCMGKEGRQELALSIFNYLRPDLWREFCADRRKTGQRVRRKFDSLIAVLHKSAKIYREIGALAPELGPRTLLGAKTPVGFADALEAEATRLAGQRDHAKIVFSKKRLGNKSDLGMLIRLQIIVEQFVTRHGDSWPKSAARRLSAADLADLLEAGKAALGLPDNQTLTDSASIERALLRFRKRLHNEIGLELLMQSATQLATKIPPVVPPPSSQS